VLQDANVTAPTRTKMYFFIVSGFKFSNEISGCKLYIQPKLIIADLNLSYENSLIEESPVRAGCTTIWVRGKTERH